MDFLFVSKWQSMGFLLAVRWAKMFFAGSASKPSDFEDSPHHGGPGTSCAVCDFEGFSPHKKAPIARHVNLPFGF